MAVLTSLLPERPKLYTILALLSEIGLKYMFFYRAQLIVSVKFRNDLCVFFKGWGYGLERSCYLFSLSANVSSCVMGISMRAHSITLWDWGNERARIGEIIFCSAFVLKYFIVLRSISASL